MRVLHVNISDLRGGASRGVFQLHQGLKSIGVDSKILVRHKLSDDVSVLKPVSKAAKIRDRLGAYMDDLPLKFYPHHRKESWGMGWFPTGIASQINRIETDIIQLHWISRGFVPIGALPRLKRPLIWTLRDTWPFTGGCHVSYDCTRYRQSCGQCPFLDSHNSHDLSYRVWQQKKKHWDLLDMLIVSPSRWLAEAARSSSLFAQKQIEVIPHGLNLDVFKPLNKRFARETLNLSPEGKIILFGAINSTADPRKGFQYLQPALALLAQGGWQHKARLLVFGASQPETPPDLGMEAHYLGYLHDDYTLALAYSAADVMVVPSIQEAFGKTAMEAMACGAPVVAFGATGLLDIIDHEQTGYLARPYEFEDLAHGIAWVLGDDDRWQKLSQHARSKTEREFEITHIAKRYLALYEEMNKRHA